MCDKVKTKKIDDCDIVLRSGRSVTLVRHQEYTDAKKKILNDFRENNPKLYNIYQLFMEYHICSEFIFTFNYMINTDIELDVSLS